MEVAARDLGGPLRTLGSASPASRAARALAGLLPRSNCRPPLKSAIRFEARGKRSRKDRPPFVTRPDVPIWSSLEPCQEMFVRLFGAQRSDADRQFGKGRARNNAIAQVVILVGKLAVYKSWVIVSTLPSLSLNHAALPAGVIAIPRAVRRPGVSYSSNTTPRPRS